MSKIFPLSVSECKIQASILLKRLYSSDTASVNQAVKRFQRLNEFVNLSPSELLNQPVKRKHALAVIALEKGFNSWKELKCQIPFFISGFLNHWFVNYEQAKQFQNRHGGYLLPYKKQFFICSADYISQLGFNPHDNYWIEIDFDWYKPKNPRAWQQLYKKWMLIQEKKDE